MGDSPRFNLRIPGPTPLPPSVRQALSRQMISHRGAEFRILFREVTERLRALFQTEGDVLLLTASGTGGMEACVVNTISPGDKVLVVSIGVFGDRFAQIAAAFGAQVVKLGFPLGCAAQPEAILQALHSNPDCRVLFVTHNETSTGVTNDIKEIAAAVRSLGERTPLLVVDAISSLGAIELPMDEWGCDIVLTASQKAWMSPPGLAMVGLNERAWTYVKQAKAPRFYFDFGLARRYAAEDATPFTPAVSVLYGLHQALALMMEEGLPHIYERHRRLARMLRAGLRDLGLRIVAEDEERASNTVTAFYTPAGVNGEELLEALAREHGLFLAEGQGGLKGKALRIAHMGYVSEKDIAEVLAALRSSLQTDAGAR